MVFTLFSSYATLPWMYLLSRIFSSSDVAFISYISLNFIFGLCTMLMTIMPRLLAIISKAQVGELYHRLSQGASEGEMLAHATLLLFQLELNDYVLVATVFNKETLTLINKIICAVLRAMLRAGTNQQKMLSFCFSISKDRPTSRFTAPSLCVDEFLIVVGTVNTCTRCVCTVLQE